MLVDCRCFTTLFNWYVMCHVNCCSYEVYIILMRMRRDEAAVIVFLHTFFLLMIKKAIYYGKISVGWIAWLAAVLCHELWVLINNIFQNIHYSKFAIDSLFNFQFLHTLDIWNGILFENVWILNVLNGVWRWKLKIKIIYKSIWTGWVENTKYS